jgi:PAS domain S-box-containing protein
MLDSDTPDPFVIGRILNLHNALQSSAGGEHLAQAVCRGLLRIPGIEDCAFCAGGTVLASSSPERTHDLVARLCQEERQEDGCQAKCPSRHMHRMARVALATQRRGYGGLLIRISDEDQYSLYEPYVDNTASLVALYLEIEKQAAEISDQSGRLVLLVRARTLELEESKARLELAVKGGDLGTWDWNVASGGVSYSERCAGMLGYTANEIEPNVRSWERLVHSEDLARVTEAMRAHLEGKTGSYQSEHRRRHASGKWVWILDRGQVVEHDAAGIPLRMCGTHLDITERKEAEQALQLSEGRLRLALEAGAMGTWDVNLETGEAMWSEAHEKLFGLAPGQFDGTVEGFLRCVHPEDLPGVKAEANRCRENRLPFRHEFRVVWPDGSVHCVSARGTFSYDPGGKPMRLLGVAWDVTERRLAEAERQRLTAAIGQAGESFVIIGRGGLIVYVNPAFERTSGYSSQEVTGQRWTVLQSDKTDDAFRGAVWAVLSAGKTWSGRSAITRKDGTPITIECTVSPVLGKLGQIEYMVAVYRDITDQLRMEEELRQAQKIESIGRLAAGVAHDFNNMLTPILGYTEILLAAMPPTDARYGQLIEIKKAAECSRDLTRQLVAFSRKQVLQVKAVDLRDVVSGIEQLLRRTVRENIALETILSAAPCPVSVDVGQVEQILMNLAMNAQDAMPQGGKLAIDVAPVELDAAFCAAHHGAKPGRYVALVVSDTGSGMDEETRQHAFEPFFSTKSDHGTGLGLSTVYGVVKQHAGSIWIESEPGKGARFSIYLPAALPQGPSEGQPPSRQAYRGTETILLVEDNEMVRKLTQSLLQMQGYKVLAFASGREALCGAEESRAAGGGDAVVDLLLADVVMPDISGRDLSAQMREKNPKLRVLFMSGYSDDAIEHQGVLEPGTDFIQKPFSVGGLAAKIREVLDREG